MDYQLGTNKIMEPIAEDIVEHAEDFFFKLDDKQVIEQISDLQKRQPWIVHYINSSNQVIKSEKMNFVVFRFTLMTDYCYRSYPVNLPIIERKAINFNLSKDVIFSHVVKDEGGEFVDYNASALLVNQIHLTEILKAKETEIEGLVNPEEPKVFGQVWLSIITVFHLYQDETIIQMSKLRLT
jgi:hypothetical protein